MQHLNKRRSENGRLNHLSVREASYSTPSTVNKSPPAHDAQKGSLDSLNCLVRKSENSMDVCILSHDGEILLHRNMQAAPEPFLKAVAPSQGPLDGGFLRSPRLAALLGPDAPGLSPTTLSRLKQVWKDELRHWQQRDLSDKRYVYFWVDAVYFGTRLETAHHGTQSGDSRDDRHQNRP